MSDYIKIEKKQSLKTAVTLTVVCALILGVFCSGFISPTVYAADVTIPLGPGVSLMALSPPPPSGSYSIEDEYGTVWTNGIEVEIFKVEYENGSHGVTVAGKGGNKVIAPGTENTYTFAVKNNYADELDYKVSIEAFFTGLDGSGKSIPVEAKLIGRLDWLLGSETEYKPVLELDGAEEGSTLYSGQHAMYTLQWRWPFEHDLDGDGNIDDGDELDTWLATQAQDFSLTIRITVQAAERYYPEEPILAPVPSWLNGVDHMAYIYGSPDGYVRPNDDITRAEVAAIIYRLLWDDIREQYETSAHPYGDIPAGAWYTNEVATLTAIGFLKGYPDGNFHGDDPMTRAELATLLARTSGHEISSKGKTKFIDIEGHWAIGEIMTIEDFNWIEGYPDGTFLPDQNITRAETVALMNRVLHRLPEKESDLLPDMVTWPDNANPKNWYYLAIQEASNSHTYQRLLGTREKWIELQEIIQVGAQ